MPNTGKKCNSDFILIDLIRITEKVIVIAIATITTIPLTAMPKIFIKQRYNSGLNSKRILARAMP
tara:strand:+ start:213 stop:407 length:195 start_codon:yes stop_codon:yes gene_type:complete